MFLLGLLNLDLVLLQQASQRLPGEVFAMPQVARGDQLFLGVNGKPVAPLGEQLVDLLLTDPVVLVVIQHRQQDVEVGQQILQRHLTADASSDVAAVAPLRERVVERDRVGLHLVAQGLEEARDHLPTADGGHHGDARLQRDGGSGESGALIAPTTNRRAVQLGDRHAHQG